MNAILTYVATLHVSKTLVSNSKHVLLNKILDSSRTLLIEDASRYPSKRQNILLALRLINMSKRDFIKEASHSLNEFELYSGMCIFIYVCEYTNNFISLMCNVLIWCTVSQNIPIMKHPMPLQPDLAASTFFFNLINNNVD